MMFNGSSDDNVHDRLFRLGNDSHSEYSFKCQEVYGMSFFGILAGINGCGRCGTFNLDQNVVTGEVHPGERQIYTLLIVLP